MLRLVHARHRTSVDRWVRHRRRQLHANPVPLLVVTRAVRHDTVQRWFQDAGFNGPVFFMDASGGHGATAQVADNIVLLSDPQRLSDAAAFMAKAHQARRCLDVLLIDEAPRPDLSWCSEHLDAVDILS